MDLPQFQMGGTSPFLTYGDTVDSCLTEARAICVILESYYRTARDLQLRHPQSEIDTIETLNPELVADAISGVASLVSLAQYCTEKVDEQREARRARAVAA